MLNHHQSTSLHTTSSDFLSSLKCPKIKQAGCLSVSPYFECMLQFIFCALLFMNWASCSSCVFLFAHVNVCQCCFSLYTEMPSTASLSMCIVKNNLAQRFCTNFSCFLPFPYIYIYRYMYSYIAHKKNLSLNCPYT